jgi:hypothetical protein
MDCTTPSLSHRAWYAADVYSEPLSEWKITPSTSPPRVAAAIFKDALTRAASW